MNKKIKLVSVVFAALTLSLVACDNGGSKSESSSTPPTSSSSKEDSSTSIHEHTFSNEWSHDAEKHWHAATCGHDVKGDEGPHTFGEWKETTAPESEKDGELTRTCSVCGYAEHQRIPQLGTPEKLQFLKYGEDDFYSVRARNTDIEGRVVIPEIHNGLPVKELYLDEPAWKGAFQECKKIEYVYIPDTVTSINKKSFMYCERLKEVSFPDTLLSIGGDAFYQCVALEEAIIPDGVTTIDYCAFQECGKLASVSIPNSVTSIGEYAFEDCTSLETIVLPDQITVLEDCLFEDCTNLKTVTLPKNLTKILDFVFYGCASLEDITLPESLTYIGDNSFLDCPKIPLNEYEGGKYIGKEGNPYFALLNIIDEDQTTYTINENCNFILEDVFHYCDNLLTISIPKSVVSIKSGAFSNYYFQTLVLEKDSKLAELGNDVFDYKPNQLVGTEVNNGLYFGSEDNPCMILIDLKDRDVTSFVVDEKCKFVYKQAFLWCGSLTSVTIPDSVVTVGESAFQECSALTEVIYGKGVDTIQSYTFMECTGLTSFVVPEGIKTIEVQAFIHCSALTSITLPKSIETIGYYAFDHCDALETITYAGTKAEWESITKPETDFWGDGIPVETVHCSDGEVNL